MSTLKPTYDVIVVGCGAFGAAAAWRLARGGKRVLALDRWAGPHGFGSSHGHTRMTRTAYYERPEYVPMLLRAHELWRELEAGTGQSLLHLCGGLYLGSEDSELLTGAAGAARLHGLEHRLLSGAELAGRFPQFKVPAGWVGLSETLAGYLLVENCVGALIDAALSAGATLRTGGAVSSIAEHAGYVEVRLDTGEVCRAAQVVVCAGAWISKLLPEVRVVPTRQVLAWFWPSDPGPFRSTPVWAFDIGRGHLLYGFPMRADRPGVKAAIHAPAGVTDPDAVDRVIGAGDIEPIRAQLREHVPLAAEGPLLHATTCLYENSRDGHFLVGALTDHIFVAGGGSGHGFKFAPVIGEILGDLVMRGETSHAIGFLSPRRFSAG